MALTWRIALHGDSTEGPEDYLASALGVVFPDDITNQHGDAEHSLVYTSPHLPKPLLIDLADPVKEDDRKLFSHYLWNSSLLLAEFVEADSLPGVALEAPRGTVLPPAAAAAVDFDIRGQTTLELGAGTGLPSIMAALLGAARVAVTDYPATPLLATLRTNILRNTAPAFAPPGAPTAPTPADSVSVHGHSWGQLARDTADDEGADDPSSFAAAHAHAFDRVIAADCLWMPWQHANLHRSIAHFLRRDAAARAWVVAGFHTGRPKMAGFFASEALGAVGLELDCIWERDCNGVEREWDIERDDDITERKRWLVVGILKWIETP